MRRTALAIIVAAALSSCSMGHYPVEQPHIAGSINISLQPAWGPAGYDYAMFYYFPDFNFYYDVTEARFYYKNYGRWVWARTLPVGRGYPTDLHRYYKVVINTPSPWRYNSRHRTQYRHYRGVTTQRVLYDVWGGDRPSQPQEYRPTSPRRIPTQATNPPARNNNTVAPPQQGSRPQGTQQGLGQGSRRNDSNRGSQQQGVGPGSRRNEGQNRQGNVGQGTTQSSGSKATGGSRTGGNSSRSSGGSRSSGSRGR